MRKANFWKRPALILLAVFTLAIFAACPGGDEDDPPLLGVLYKGDTLEDIDLSAVTVDTTVEDWVMDPSGGKVVYKKPKDVTADGGPSNLDKALKWLKTNAEDNTKYTIVIDEDLTYTPTIDLELWEDSSKWKTDKYLLGVFDFNSQTLNKAKNVTVVIKSAGEARRTIRMNASANDKPAYLMRVGTTLKALPTAADPAKGAYQPLADAANPNEIWMERKVNVVLENIVLRGLSGSSGTSRAPMNFVVGPGATLTLGEKAVVGYHHNKRGESPGEWGGEDWGGSTDGRAWGGGFDVIYGSTLIVDGGEIRDNIVETTKAGQNAQGAAVFMNNAGSHGSTLHLKKGKIINNTAMAVVNSAGNARGGVVAFYNWGEDKDDEKCKFIMEDGEISGNKIVGGGTARGSVIGDAYQGNIGDTPVQNALIKITGGLIKNNTATSGDNKGWITAGFLMQWPLVTLGGSPDIQQVLFAGILDFADTVKDDPTTRQWNGYGDGRINVLPGFKPKTPVQVDIYTGLTGTGITNVQIDALKGGETFAKWVGTPGANDTLAGKFKLNNWLFLKDDGKIATSPITQVDIGADGKTKAK